MQLHRACLSAYKPVNWFSGSSILGVLLIFVDSFPGLKLDSGNTNFARRLTCVSACFLNVTRGIFIEVKIFRNEVLGKKKYHLCPVDEHFSLMSLFSSILNPLS